MVQLVVEKVQPVVEKVQPVAEKVHLVEIRKRKQKQYGDQLATRQECQAHILSC